MSRDADGAHFRQDITVGIRLLEQNARKPEYQSALASGADLFACLNENCVIPPGERGVIPTGISMEIPEGFEIQIRPRSGAALRQGLFVLNSPGTIDADYRGEIRIILANFGKESIVIQNGERIAQAVLCPVYTATFLEKFVLSETQRGAGGFGSTGA